MKQISRSSTSRGPNGNGYHAPSGPKLVNGDSNGATHNGHVQPIRSHDTTQAKEMTELLMSLMRNLFAVDDQAGELPLRQLRVCAMLYEQSRSMTSLSKELGVSLSAMTQIADRLERARLVKRSFKGTDRRVRSLQLTPRAQRIMQHRENSRVERASAALERLTQQQRAEVLAMLQTLHAASTNLNSETGTNGHSLNGHSSDEMNS
ncbi:MAG TPA: MarR family transcriptional regulator [Pirellulales bacterium]|jgi:DNA-binding MarR family transcriptional regulator